MRFYIRGGGQLSKRNNTGKIEDLGSGENIDGEISKHDFIFIDVSKDSDYTKNGLYGFATEGRGVGSTEDGSPVVLVAPISMFNSLVSYLGVSPKAIKVDLGAKFIMHSSGQSLNMTYREYILQNGFTEEQISSLPQITEEEFYNLEV